MVVLCTCHNLYLDSRMFSCHCKHTGQLKSLRTSCRMAYNSQTLNLSHLTWQYTYSVAAENWRISKFGLAMFIQNAFLGVGGIHAISGVWCLIRLLICSWPFARQYKTITHDTVYSCHWKLIVNLWFQYSRIPVIENRQQLAKHVEVNFQSQEWAV